MLGSSLLLALATITVSRAQQPPDSFPHSYPGIPNDDYNFSDATAWQNYYRVGSKLPNVTFEMEQSFAGNIPVNRHGHPNDTLFFWAFESYKGSLTRHRDKCKDDPWIIWLNGGPGSSSMIGLLFENGPLHVVNDFSLVKNDFGWNTLADTVWIDQPVGTGFSTADSEGYIDDEDQMGRDFFGFLTNLVKVFPSLAKRPLYLTGESYAGTFIPYITKTYFGMEYPPVKLAKIAIGDGAMSSEAGFEDSPIVSIIETYPQLIGYDSEVYEYFKEQRHLCGYDVNLTYPQKEPLPPLLPNERDVPAMAMQGRTPRSLTREAIRASLKKAHKEVSSLGKRELAIREEKKRAWKRDLSMRANGTIDPFYQCFLLFELIDYAVNFTRPWSINNSFATELGFDVYSIPDALDPEAPQDASVFLNDAVTRSALHAPTSKNWTESFQYPFGNNPNPPSNTNGTNLFGDPSHPPMTFFDELAANSSKHRVKWIMYSGNDDLLVAHLGTDIVIQNTTFKGTRGFTRRPKTDWYDDEGKFAGIVHQERDITYVLFEKAGHLIPQWQPSRALTFVREFVLGTNSLGAVLSNGEVVGGEDDTFDDGVLEGEHNPIFTGLGTTMGSTLWPSATIAAWDKFISTARATPVTTSRGY